MRISAGRVEVWAPAKLNLFLEVLAKRADGFHEIETLMCPISLFDTLIVRDVAMPASCETRGNCEAEQARSTPAIRLRCRWSQTVAAGGQLEQIPEGPDNTVYKAIQGLRQYVGARRGVSVEIIKRIPSAAGLAGGSSDAAAVLMALLALWQVDLSDEEVLDLAAQVGSDVPFFLTGSAAICRGRGEDVEPLPSLGPLHFVVVCPPEGLSTADVYRNCQPASTPCSATRVVEALQRGQRNQIGSLLHNQLQPAARQLSPWIERLEQIFSGMNVVGHQMSGSGTSYFALCRTARQARQLARTLRSRRLGRVYYARSLC